MKNTNMDCSSCPNVGCFIKQYGMGVEAEKYLAQKNTIRCKKSQNIIIEGSPVHGLFFVRSGKVKVMNTGIHGREQILRFAMQGEMIGQRGFSSQQYYPIGAVALDETVVCNFSLPVLKQMLQDVPKLTYAFMVYYAEELNRSETKVRKFAHMTVRDKVIDALLYIHRKFGQVNGYFDIVLSRKDIADFAGTTDEQVIRVLSSLKKEKLIVGAGKKLGIANVDVLRKEIDEHHFFIQS